MPKDNSRAAAKILHAATKIFAERGYHGTTTRAVSDELGMSATALYPHFQSKEELLYAITLDAHQQALDAMQDVDPDLAPAERLSETVRVFALWHAHNNTLGRAAQHDLSAMSPEHLATIVELRRQTTQHVQNVIAGGIADGSFGIDDATGHAIAVISLCSDICRWFPSRAYSSADELSAMYADIALRIVGARTSPEGRQSS